MLLSSRGWRILAAALGWSVGLLGPGAAPGHSQEVAAEAPPAGEDPAPTPRVLFHAFGDIDWLSRRADVPGTFSVGQLDLFATAALT
ncbi:MAG TPA: hypothetical protein VGB87_03200, partial [Vicinamibacteria bacterium]